MKIILQVLHKRGLCPESGIECVGSSLPDFSSDSSRWPMVVIEGSLTSPEALVKLTPPGLFTGHGVAAGCGHSSAPSSAAAQRSTQVDQVRPFRSDIRCSVTARGQPVIGSQRSNEWVVALKPLAQAGEASVGL